MANLGPGFDALGLALDLWNEAEFTCTDDKQISISPSRAKAQIYYRPTPLTRDPRGRSADDL